MRELLIRGREAKSGSAANGLLTFNGSWGRLRTDPAATFMVLALVCYAGTTFEGSMMAIKSVSLRRSTWTALHAPVNSTS